MMLSPSMPPRMNTTTMVRLVLTGSANAYRLVTSWVPNAATPTAPAPAMTRRRVNPRRQRSFSRARLACTDSACTRMAASVRFGPCRRSSSALRGVGTPAAGSIAARAP
jgi:hypothetical protein